MAYNLCPCCNKQYTNDRLRKQHLAAPNTILALDKTYSLSPSVFTVNNHQDAKKCAKGNAQNGKIGGVSFVRKAAKKPATIFNDVSKPATIEDRRLLLFNEVSGYNMVKRAVEHSVPEASMIPPDIYIDKEYAIYTTAIGKTDIKEWLATTRTLAIDVIEQSAHFIIDRVHAFISTINCHSETPVYHCDLHLENVRLDIGETGLVTAVFIIDFDSVRSGMCDTFRSSSRVFGYTQVASDMIQNKLVRTTRPEMPKYTDWAFLNTIRYMLYRCLVDRLVTKIGQKPKFVQDDVAKIKSALGPFNSAFDGNIYIHEVEKAIFPLVITPPFTALEERCQSQIRRVIYTKMANIATKEAHINGVHSYCSVAEVIQGKPENKELSSPC